MPIATVKVSDKGQIAIPQSVRERMRIKKGDSLVLFQLEDGILLEKSERVESRMKDDFKDLVKFSEKTIKKVWDNKTDEIIWKKYLKK
jgi:AbrB family looped-hinge helix DNA binding protein